MAPKLSKHRWSHANDKIASLEGLPLIIKCPVVGSPSPDISWMKNDIPLNVNREMLHIGTARKEHTGNYTCVATNNAGNISKSFLVDVLGMFYLLSAPGANLGGGYGGYIPPKSENKIVKCWRKKSWLCTF